MGELLQFRKKEVPGYSESLENKKIPEIHPELDIEHIIFMLDTLTSVLATMRGNVRVTRGYLADHTELSSLKEEDLVQRIKDTSEQSVQHWPKYHAALFDVAKERGIIRGSR